MVMLMFTSLQLDNTEVMSSYTVPSQIQANKYPASVGVNGITPLQSVPPIGDVVAVPVVLTNGTWVGVSPAFFTAGSGGVAQEVDVQPYASPAYFGVYTAESGAAQVAALSGPPGALIAIGSTGQVQTIDPVPSGSIAALLSMGGQWETISTTAVTNGGYQFIDSSANWGFVNFVNKTIPAGSGTQLQFSTSTGQLTYTASTIKIKENIEVFTPERALGVVAGFPRAVTFNFKADKDHRVIGNIAEELDGYLGHDGDLGTLVTRDADGSPSGIRYDLYPPLLMAALQGLMDRHEELERRLKRKREDDAMFERTQSYHC